MLSIDVLISITITNVSMISSWSDRTPSQCTESRLGRNDVTALNPKSVISSQAEKFRCRKSLQPEQGQRIRNGLNQ